MKVIKITPELSKQFTDSYKASLEPVFKISGYREITHGCKVIRKTDKAVFVYVSSFLWCGGFWMPIETYNTLNNGYILAKSNPINYNNTIYQY